MSKLVELSMATLKSVMSIKRNKLHKLCVLVEMVYLRKREKIEFGDIPRLGSSVSRIE